jgi:arylsulfatase A-like enzyme
MDVFPTLLDLTAKIDLNVEGKSFLPVLYANESWENRTIYWHSDKARPRNTGDTNSSAIRMGKFKLIHWYENDVIELYNMDNDPYEKNNLVDTELKLSKKLLLILNNWKEKMK